MSRIRLVLMAVACAFGVARSAHADPTARVVVLTDPSWPPPIGDALAVELTARAIEFERVEVTAGQATAARELVASGAAAAVLWVEPDRVAGTVMVLGADRSVHRAALPAALPAVTPRVFALIAASLADETLSPPPPIDGMAIDVDVTVAPDADTADPPVGADQPPTTTAPEPAEPLAPAEPAPLSPPALAEPGSGPAVGMTLRPSRAGRWFVEAGGVSALISNGLMIGVGRHLTDRVRLHLIGELVYVIPAEEQATLIGVAVSRTPPRRGFQIGASAGWVTMPDAHGFAAGPWLGWRWPLGHQAALDGRLAVEIGTMDGESFFPVPLATVAVELPL